jgi:hypothetical protein
MNHFRMRDKKTEQKPEPATMADFAKADRVARAPKIAKRDAQVAKQRSHFRGR